MWFWVVVLVLIIGGIAVLAAGRDDAMTEVYDDRPDATVPAGRLLTAEDLAAVRFSTALRGYRMDEVDALLDRLQADLRAREAAASSQAAQVEGSHKRGAT
jgi:DivIVA domain-containing protein